MSDLISFVKKKDSRLICHLQVNLGPIQRSCVKVTFASAEDGRMLFHLCARIGVFISVDSRVRVVDVSFHFKLSTLPVDRTEVANLFTFYIELHSGIWNSYIPLFSVLDPNSHIWMWCP